MALGDERATARNGFASRASRVEVRKGGACAFNARDRTGAAQGRVAGDVSMLSSTEGRTVRAQPAATQKQALRRSKSLAAVAGAAVAVALASVGYGTWATASSRAAVEEATAGALPTLVAVSDIRAGDRISIESVEVKEVPRAFRPQGVLGAEAFADGGGQGRALVDIPAGAPIAASFVTGSQGDGRLSAELEAGKEAVTIAVDAETGLAGRIRPYDAVRVVTVEGASAGMSLLETICDRARVVAVGEEASIGEAAYTSVTVEVSHDEADAVREAQYAGRVSLVLLAAEDALEEASPEDVQAKESQESAFDEGEAADLG